MLLTVNGLLCSEDFGACEKVDCDQVCKSKHPAGQSICEVTSRCKCFFPCAGTNKKTCNVSLETPSGSCSTDQCNLACLLKFPVAKDGQGACYNAYPFVGCHCFHLCD